MFSCYFQLPRTLAVAGVLAVASFAGPTSAATFFDVTAQLSIRQIDSGPDGLGAQNVEVLDAFGLTLGSELTATYLIDTAVPAVIDDDFGTQTYVYYAIHGGVVLSSGGTFESDLEQNPAISVVDRDPGAPDIFNITSRGAVATGIGSVNFLLNTGLYDEEGEALSGPELDLGVFSDLALWDNSLNTGLLLTLIFPNGEFANVNAEFVNVSVTPVPLPAAFVLFASGLLVFGRVFRRSPTG